ncbi:kinetochore protein Nuf2 [Pancytospora philotis]|nr:kinetochore protein Nuf2 [Pancytospora philotis]
MNQHRVYAVPDLPLKDITSYFAEMGMEIAAAEILKPTALSTQRIYEGVLALFVGGVSDIADESFMTIRLVQRMGCFLERIGMPGFTVRDLQPESRRLITLLSTAINFGMFRDNKRHVYERVGQIADTNYAQRKLYEGRIEGLHEETRRLTAQLAENTEQTAACNSEVAVLEEELRKLYKHQKDKVGEVSLLKNEKTELGDRLSAAQLLEHNLKQEIACLRTQIVSDPTRLMELVDEMRQLVEKERESIRSTEESIASSRVRYERAARCSELFGTALDLCRAIAQADSKIEEIEQESAAAEGRLKAWDSRINALKIRTNHVERQISHLQSKIHNLQTRDKRSSEEITEKIASLRLKYDAVSDERAQMLDRVDGNKRKTLMLKAEKNRIAAEYEDTCLEFMSLLSQFNEEVERYFLEQFSCID